MLVYSAFIFSILLLIFCYAIFGYRNIHYLHKIPINLSSFPTVTIIVPARNEEKTIVNAIRKMREIDYPHFEILIINDRSTDQTETQIKNLCAEDSRIKYKTITELPEGWLGKNYALHQGAAESHSDYLLFTDADVHMKKNFLMHALSACELNQLDHLTASPRMFSNNFVLKLIVSGFSAIFFMRYRPWLAKNPKKSQFMGIGACNLIKRSVYIKLKIHETIRLRPDDDLQLGHVVKLNGFRQEFFFAEECISVEWYRTIPELIRGLEKNLFSAVNYKILPVILGTIGGIVFFFSPFIGPFFSHGLAQGLFLGSVVLIVLYLSGFAPIPKLPLWSGVFIPFGILIMTLIIWRTVLLTYWRGGIIWRGTFTSLKDLRKQGIIQPKSHDSAQD